jgi:transcription elongation factor GreA
VADYAQKIGLGGADSAQRLHPVKAFLTYWKDQGWIQNGLATHLRVPRTRRNTLAKSSSRDGQSYRSVNSSQLSQEGYDRLVTQLEDLKGERVGVVEEIKLAMADKDFRENAPLDAAKDHQGIIESRIRVLETSIANAQIRSDTGSAAVTRSTEGARVTLKDVGSGRVVSYTLVDIREADAATGKISTQSPVGHALLDRTVGEEVTINVPRGTLQYLVQKIVGS